MYEIADCMAFDNLNEYFVRAKQNNAELYFAHFLSRYEPVLNHKAQEFSFRYAPDADRTDDLKQIFAALLWDKLKGYSPDNPIPFLQTVKYDVLRAWHEYIRTSCGATAVMSEKTYAAIRKVSQIYFSLDSLPENERISTVCEKLGLTEGKAKDLLSYAKQFRYTITVDSYNDSEDQPYIIESSPSAEDEYFRYERRREISETAEKFSKKEIDIFYSTVGVCPFCFGSIPQSEQKTYEQLALIHGFSGGDVIEKQRKKIMKKLQDALEEKS